MIEESRKISVIVPVYNVEKYLDRCVNSIVGQTYRNLEIILVDDGSTDSSREKVDEWKKKDERIQVIHRENGGLSAARNTGIEVATGTYLIFVDSDDWIRVDMIEVLVEGLKKADIVCCGMIHATDTEESEIAWFSEEHVLSSDEVIRLLVSNSIFTSHIVKNIFPKYIFEKVRFPEGKVFEDIRIAHRLFLEVEKICILPGHYYYYYERSNSISNVVKLSNRIEWYDALVERGEELKELLTVDERENICSQMAVVMSLAIVQNRFTDDEKEELKMKMFIIKDFLKKKSTKYAVKKYATRSQYIYYCFARVFFYSANILYRYTWGRKCH